MFLVIQCVHFDRIFQHLSTEQCMAQQVTIAIFSILLSAFGEIDMRWGILWKPLKKKMAQFQETFQRNCQTHEWRQCHDQQCECSLD